MKICEFDAQTYANWQAKKKRKERGDEIKSGGAEAEAEATAVALGKQGCQS